VFLGLKLHKCRSVRHSLKLPQETQVREKAHFFQPQNSFAPNLGRSLYIGSYLENPA